MELELSRIWFIMMRQLGFDPVKIGATYKLKVSEEMFRIANPRGLEIVLYFLLTKFDPIKSREKFKPCWPIQDKNEERQFRKLCIDWLNELGAIYPSLGFNTTRKPSVILLNPIGDRVYRFLLSFTHCVLMAQLNTFPARYKHSIPALPHPGNETKPEILTRGATRASQAMTVDQFQQFLFWVSQRHKLMTTCLETKLRLCEDIKQLRKGNRERQKRIGELSNVSRKSGSRRSGAKCVAEVLPNIEGISEQISQLTSSLDKFSSNCDTLNDTLTFGDKQTQICGTKINLKLEDPILSSYEKLYRNGRIGALYSDKNEICFGAFLQLGKLSLVIAEDLIGQFKGPPLFSKWCKALEEIGTKNDLVSVLDGLEVKMGDFKLEPTEVEHHNNRINALELELKSFEDSEFACLFVPLNLTDKVNKMYSEMFQIPEMPPINVESIPCPFLPPDYGGRATQSSGIATQSFEPSIPPQLIVSSNESKPDLPPFKLNKRFKHHSGTETKKVPKSKEQIIDELTDQITSAIMSEDTFDFETQFFNDPSEALDEVSAFQSKDSITRTPDSTVTKVTRTKGTVKHSLATQSPDSDPLECVTTLPHPFLSPLRDVDD